MQTKKVGVKNLFHVSEGKKAHIRSDNRPTGFIIMICFTYSIKDSKYIDQV